MKPDPRTYLSNPAADYLEIRLEERRSTSVSYQGKELDDISERENRGGCVRACHKGGWGFCSFNLDSDLERAVREAVTQARATGTGITRLRALTPVRDCVVQAFGQDPRSVSLEEKKEIARKYNDYLLAQPRIVSTRVSYLDRHTRTHLLSSHGADVEQERTFTGITLMAMARDGMNVQRAYHSAGDHRGFGNVRGLESKAEEIAKRTVDLLAAPKVQSGRTTVILDPKLAGVFAHEAFGHMSEADFIFDNPAIAEKMKRGLRFGTDALNIVDNGTLLEECGGYAYDDEGVRSQKSYLIKNGVLDGHLHSRETAERMDAPGSGNARAISYRFRPIVRMSCTYIEPGAETLDALLAGVPDGIYAAGMLGGNTDLEQFTFSAEYAYQIKDGKQGELLRDVILTGNLFETLHNIDAVGNDLTLFGGMGGCGKEGQSPLPVSDGGPHLRIRNLLIG
ncbi:MAG: TldD/PmbA family protein [Fibrobacterota bacterium]